MELNINNNKTAATIVTHKKTIVTIFGLHIVSLAIWHHLFLELWLVDTWFFAHLRHRRAVTHLENVRQLNIRPGKKLGFQLPHTQPR